ncbi:MAG: 3'-5' exonuclease [Paraclostridium sp.]
MLKKYPIGSDLTLIETIYHYPRKGNDGKYDKGSIDIIYKDNITNDKHVETIENPDYRFYIVKAENRVSYNRYFIHEDDVEEIFAPFNELEKHIAMAIGEDKFYYDNIRSGNRRDNKRLHRHPDVFNSDSNIEDHYRERFAELYTNNISTPDKLYFDIEVDTINMRGDFPEHGECPVNATAIICDNVNKVYILLLRNKNNPLIQEFENSIGPELFDELKSFVKDQVNGWKNEIRFGLNNLEYEFMFYDEEDEISLIYDIFKIMRVTQPDIILAWNMMSFDTSYLIERIKILGYDPVDIICDNDFPNKKVVNYYIDDIDREGNKKALAERGDFTKISMKSVFLDQMIHFASRRKGQSSFQNFKLDYIGEIIAGVTKLDYHHITTSIAKLPYLDYKTFVFYNIIDTVVQKCIEVRTGDIDYVFAKCNMNNTRYNKCHRQTAYLINRAGKEFYNEGGYIIGNNVNQSNKKTPYPGALVANPGLINDYAKRTIAGKPVLLFDNLDDYDYTALYPSILREFNMAPNTQVGRIIIPDGVLKNENPFNKPSKNHHRSGVFLEDIHSRSFIDFGNRWLNLAGYSEMYDDVIEYFKTVELSRVDLCTYNNGYIRLYREIGELKPSVFIQSDNNPIKLYTKVHKRRPDSIYDIPNSIDISKIVCNDQYDGDNTKEDDE